MQMEMVVVNRQYDEKDVNGKDQRKTEEVYRSDGLVCVEKSSSREDILRRPEVFEKTKDIAGKELVVLVASVPFCKVECC